MNPDQRNSANISTFKECVLNFIQEEYPTPDYDLRPRLVILRELKNQFYYWFLPTNHDFTIFSSNSVTLSAPFPASIGKRRKVACFKVIFFPPVRILAFRKVNKQQTNHSVPRFKSQALNTCFLLSSHSCHIVNKKTGKISDRNFLVAKIELSRDCTRTREILA